MQRLHENLRKIGFAPEPIAVLTDASRESLSQITYLTPMVEDIAAALEKFRGKWSEKELKQAELHLLRIERKLGSEERQRAQEIYVDSLGKVDDAMHDFAAAKVREGYKVGYSHLMPSPQITGQSNHISGILLVLLKKKH